MFFGIDLLMIWGYIVLQRLWYKGECIYICDKKIVVLGKLSKDGEKNS